jgi:hypothetical protein
MARAQITNNAVTTLSGSLTNVATSFNVTGGGGGKFPSSGYFYVTVVDAANIPEIMKCTTRSVDTFTVTRGQDGTAARAFTSGAVVTLAPIAAVLAELVSSGDSLADPAFITSLAGSKISGAVASATAAGDSTTLGGVASSSYARKDAAQTFTKGQSGAYTVLTDGATITPDFSLANMFRVGLAGNRTLANPSNLVAGQSGTIDIYQDGTGSRTLAYQWGWQFTQGSVPVLSTTARAKDKLAYQVDVYAQSAVTISNSSPGVVTWNAHGLMPGQQVQLTTTGGLPTGLLPNTTYFVVPIDANSFSLSATQSGASINTSSAGSGVHTMTAVSITANLLRSLA